MNDQASAGDGGRKRRSFIEAAELYHQIVPLPGSAAEARPNIAADDLPPLTGPQAIPDPPRSPALVVPSAPVIPQPRAQAAPEPAASIEPIPPLPPTPPSVPPAHDEIPSPAVAAPAVATLAVTAPPRRVRLWPWAALLLVAACVAAAWVERTRLVSVTHTAMPRLFASKAHRPPTFAAPAAVPAPQLASEAPPPPPVAAAISQPSPQAAAPRAAAPEPAPAAPPPPPPETSPAATPPVSAPAAPPSAPTEAAPAPAAPAPAAPAPPAPAPAAPAPPAPAPAAPAPATPSAAATAPDAGSQGPGPASTAAEPPAAESAPTPEPTSEPARTEPAASAPKSDAAPAPVPAVVPPPAESPASSPPAAPARKDWQVVIYYHSGSSAAEAEAARLTALLGPLTERVSMWQANAVPHLPAVVYFHPEDAAAAQDLAALLGQPASGEWHTRALPPPRTRRPPGTFEVWLPIP